jgi:hypothetical protein
MSAIEISILVTSGEGVLVLLVLVVWLGCGWVGVGFVGDGLFAKHRGTVKHKAMCMSAWSLRVVWHTSCITNPGVEFILESPGMFFMGSRGPRGPPQ